MTLMIDNYDSFTYNLVQYLGELGADLTVIRNDEKTVEEIVAMKPDSIIISPGPGRPENAGVCVELITKSAGDIPILGVCLGHQAIGMAFGAEIDYAPTLMHGKTSSTKHKGTSLFADVPNPFTATRYHSLVLRRSTIPNKLKITSESDDGVVMSVESEVLNLYGVQFHPESIMTPDGKTILRNFLRLAGVKKVMA